MEKISRFFVKKRAPWLREGKIEGELEGMPEKSMDVMVNLILKSDHDGQFIAGIVGAEAKAVSAIRKLIKKKRPDYFS